MISIDIQGGLGNQLFMIFATFAYSIQHNVKVVFPFHNGSNNRGTYWDSLFSDLTIFTTKNPNNNVDVSSFNRFNESTFTYQPLPYFGDQNISLFGYFQSHKYFEQYKTTIYKLMHLSDRKQAIKEKHSQLFNKKTLSIHFRMGDYKQKRYYHPIMNYEYFESALTHVMNSQEV
jgi:hypothetical protein